mmetsp:Transcript_88727/g.202949  ORF Transcript_88727/g.202949 Transcript_88727/m.202949 type:complete len:182 (+) Transcript_88727:127-672(+)
MTAVAPARGELPARSAWGARFFGHLVHFQCGQCGREWSLRCRLTASQHCSGCGTTCCAYDNYRRQNSRVVLASGITLGQARELQGRELTAEDFELLLSLDKTVPAPRPGPETYLRRVPQGDVAVDWTCSICQHGQDDPAEVCVTPCLHQFHKYCVVRWFDMGQKRCPMCNQAVAPDCDDRQ